MNFTLTEEQQALKKEFVEFFKEEMKDAPTEYQKGRAGSHLWNRGGIRLPPGHAAEIG